MWKRGRAGLSLAVVVLVVGLGIGVGAGILVQSVQRHSTEQSMDRRAGLAQIAVAAEVRRYLDILRTVAASIGGYDTLSTDRFRSATAPLVDARLFGATSIAYVVAATDAQVPPLQVQLRATDPPGPTLMPVGTGREHYFALYVQSLDRHPQIVNGVDIAQLPEATGALVAARATGQPTVSRPYVLLRDRSLPAGQRQLSFVVCAPVYGPGAAGPGPALRGWVTMGMHGQDFVSGVVRDVTEGVVNAELYATDRTGQRVRVATLDTVAHPDLYREVDLPVADQHWTLRTTASTAALIGSGGLLPAGTGLALGAAGVLLAGLVWVLATGRDRARAQVVAATDHLRTAERTARTQADLLRAILDALTEGVSVVNKDAEFELQNPAAKQIVGVPTASTYADRWQEYYGIFRPDGRTPYPTDELPMMLALRGRPSDDVEMVIRNANRPEGTLVSVSGRPLADVGGAPGAMVVFRDITALREHEDDLTAFAGVVAHDLKAPLATITSYTELASEEIDELLPGTRGAEVRRSLDRVTAGARRAADLIDDLLAFTTSRDARLRIATVDLDEMVRQVVAERTADIPKLSVDVRPLGTVDADPGMLRRVLDNLVGNAVKYVRPGGVPHIEVRTEPSGTPGWVRLVVADRGIGIPDEEKRLVFDAFHRAHPGDGYTGTGLGLAICRRIVKRHGGDIEVADNPGGGTRVIVILPAVPAPAR